MKDKLAYIIVGLLVIFMIYLFGFTQHTLLLGNQELDDAMSRLVSEEKNLEKYYEHLDKCLNDESYSVILEWREASDGEIAIISRRPNNFLIEINEDTKVITVLERNVTVNNNYNRTSVTPYVPVIPVFRWDK